MKPEEEEEEEGRSWK